MANPIHRVNDSQTRECGNGRPRCRLAPAPGSNPLGLCVDCLATYNARLTGAAPPECPACTPWVIVRENGKAWHTEGAMCFACGMTSGGTVATEEHRAKARAGMRARMLALYKAGDRSAEWTALFARCPGDIRAAFERRIAAVIP